MLTIDGSMGEGGGQILRTALGLSLVTGRPFRVEHIRARRPRPGLQNQHLTAVRAAVEVGRARVTGDALGSSTLHFEPRTPRPGAYRFATGSAGSATLVLQTVLPALLSADAPTSLVLEGGTHNPWAPPFDFLLKAFLPLLQRMGARVEARLHRPGFYPAGGGRVEVTVHPWSRAERRGIDLLEAGAPRPAEARVYLSRLPRHIAEREAGVLAHHLSIPPERVRIEVADGAGPGNAVVVELPHEHVTEVVTAFGERGRPAEVVAEQAAREACTWREANVPVGEHLADQLLLPMALAGEGSFVTGALSLHCTTNMEVIRRFLPSTFETVEQSPGRFRVTLTGQGVDP